MLLEETVDLMKSSDYKERFIAEYLQLAIRYNRLKDMLEKWDTGGVEHLGFAPKCPRSTYSTQIIVMADYLAVLEARAVMEDIDLSEYIEYYVSKGEVKCIR